MQECIFIYVFIVFKSYLCKNQCDLGAFLFLLTACKVNLSALEDKFEVLCICAQFVYYFLSVLKKCRSCRVLKKE